MRNAALLIVSLSLATPVGAQTPAPATPPVATDVTAVDIATFINALPRDAVSDRPIRVVDVTGDYRVGVYGVFRPEDVVGGPNLHQVSTTEIYYMLEGSATLVTGGTMVRFEPPRSRSTTTVLFSAWARAITRFAAIWVLPTPPLPAATGTTVVLSASMPIPP